MPDRNHRNIKKVLFICLLFCFHNFLLLAQDTNPKIDLQVSADTSLYHKPLQIIASGLAPAQKVKFQLDVIDAEQNHWQSHAIFVVNESGVVDLSTAESIDGSYTGKYPMGLFWSMKSADDHQIATGRGYSAKLKLFSKEKELAQKSFYRRSTRELDQLDIEVLPIRDSIIADYYRPKRQPNGAAIIFLGGSGGHFRQERASLFASEGFAVLNLKYFKHEGLPSGITEVPLEYVEKAHQFLLNRPELNPNKIGIMGRSMGSQLALLYAAHYSGLQYVVAEAPSNVVWFGWEDGKSSFTYQGQSFPYAYYTDEDSERLEKEMIARGEQYRDGPKFLSAFKDTTMIERTAIQVEDIRCPILFISGQEDMTWPSAMMANRMMERLKVKQFKYDYQHFSYDNAGHNFAGGGQGCGIPYLPPEDYSQSSAKGGTDMGNALAASQSWKDILEFIKLH